MDAKTASTILSQVRAERTKQAQTAAQPTDAQIATFNANLAQANQDSLTSQALGNVRNVVLGSIGAGIAARGAVGLINHLMEPPPPRKAKSGPVILPVAQPTEKTALWKLLTDFVSGNKASTPEGMPWYGPAMLGGGMAGAALGYKGTDMYLNARREKERQAELERAQQEFQDALMAQYQKPPIKTGSAEPSTMQKVGEDLDTLWQRFSAALPAMDKQSIDWANMAGGATSLYGIYGLLSSLGAGAIVYDRMKKRSRGEVLEKALERRRRKEFLQSPTEMLAIPELVDRPRQHLVIPITSSPPPAE